MKAVVYEKYGSPDVLYTKEVEKPTPKDNEVLIKVNAVEVTKADCELRSFHFPVKWFWLPLRIAMGIVKPRRQVLGGYFSGEIKSVGKDVSKFKKGDLIFGASKLRMGAYGEYVCLPADYTLVSKPENMSFAEAAAVPLGGLNALHFLNKADIQNGERVLVIGAGGSIGTFGVQIAKYRGAEVTAVDSAHKEEMLRRIGVDHFIDYNTDDFAEHGTNYDVIFNMVARIPYRKCISVLNPRGRYVMANPRLSGMLMSILTTRFSDKSAIFAFAGETEQELLALKTLIEAGKIYSTVDKIYSYAQASEAHQRVESEQRLGSVVISANPNDNAR